MNLAAPSIENLSSKIKNPFIKGPALVVLELQDNLVRMSLVVVSGKEISIEETFTYQCQNNSQEALLGATATLAKEHLNPARKYKYIILADHHFITTSRSGVSSLRKEPEVKITRSELENLISKSLWKIFSNQRSRASKKTETVDINLSLVDADFVQIKLDKNRVMDPVGFSAKTFEFWAKQTIASKKFLGDIYDIFPEEEVIFFQEIAGPISDIVFSTASKDTDFLLVIIGPSETAFYRSRGDSFYYLDKINWGSDQLFLSISKTLGLAKEEALKIFNLYTAKEASLGVLKKIENIINEEVAVVLKGVEQYQQKSNLDKVYIHSLFPSPDFFNNSKLRKKMAIKNQLHPVDKKLIGQKASFELKLNSNKIQFSFTTLISAIKYLELKKFNPALEKITHQRARLLKDV